MKKSGPATSMSNKIADKNIKEVTAFLRIIGCRLKKKDQVKYEVMCGREDSGLAIAFEQETVGNKARKFVMAVAHHPMPVNDIRFFKFRGEDEAEVTLPNVLAVFTDKKDMALFYEFLSRSVYYFQASKALRKWHCYNCGEAGYEIFLDNATIGTFDAKCSEFRLLILNSDQDIEGAVFDDKINENVLPICSECREQLGYTLEDDKGLEVDEVYFTRFLEKRVEGGQVMVGLNLKLKYISQK
jgi:hypothetical protein